MPTPRTPRFEPPTPGQLRDRRLGLLLTTAGVEIGVAVALGVFGGQWLDGQLGTTPWLTLALTLCGVAAGFLNLIRTVRRAQRHHFPDEPQGPPPGGT